MSLKSFKFQIRTHLYDETIAYYQTLFAAQLVDSWQGDGDTGTILKFPSLDDKVLLEIYKIDKRTEYSGFTLQFKVPSLPDFMLQLPLKYMSTRPVKRPWGATYLYLRDPNDINVIVYQLT